ncbi:hypothetical protein FNU79_08780 [Deinococcus detaillensis]|uniref:Uncharacterized protein n=1 Tax=Deinococcus detaillensis TaxID=2592048 RepID=A0A553V083_9DEIO|nr:hypothetical protein [Deinococcus detaillensis]TSA85868.1 hypothetical protein FNU79_08780 [Deinococcus detaillensis]
MLITDLNNPFGTPITDHAGLVCNVWSAGLGEPKEGHYAEHTDHSALLSHNFQLRPVQPEPSQ